MKQKILTEIERMLSIYDDDNIHDVAKYNVLIDIRDFINSLPEEPVSKESVLDLKDMAINEVKSVFRKELLKIQEEQNQKFKANPTERIAGTIDCIDSILHSMEFVDFKEELIREDLEEATKEHCYDKQYDVTEIIDGENDFIAGALWDKERIINKAVEWLNSNVTYTHPTRGEKCIVNINAFKKAMKDE